MTQFVVALVGGLALGGIYALISLGLVLAYRATGTFNFAHGQLMLFAASVVVFYEAGSGTIPFSIVAILATVATGAVAVGFFYLVLQRMTGMPHFMGIIATLGLAAVFDGLIHLMFGTGDAVLVIPGLPSGVVEIVGARIGATSIVIAAVTIVIALCVAGFLRYTQVGTQIRASGQDPVLASQGGINVRTLYAVSWAVAGVLAAIAGFAYGADNIVGPSMINVALLAFPAILLGGLDSIEGAVTGGMIVGVMQGFVSSYLGGDLVDVLTYVLLLFVLLVRPQGIFGTPEVTRL